MADKSLTVIFLLLVTFISSTTANFIPKHICPKKRPTDEPFGNHKQTPRTIPKVVKTLDLGRADWKETPNEHVISEDIPGTIPKGVETLGRPDWNWKETPNEHVISVDTPGMEREDLKIEVEENKMLRVSGERKREEEIEGEKWHRAERISRKLRMKFRLPGNADPEKIGAHLENGVLKIRVPKLSEEKKKQSRVISIAERWECWW